MYSKRVVHYITVYSTVLYNAVHKAQIIIVQECHLQLVQNCDDCDVQYMTVM